MNGASKVIGIEGRRDLVEKGKQTMKKYEIPDEKYSFIVGDLFEEINKIDEKIDLVFCFGIFYHIMNHTLLLSSIKKLQPHYLILDSAVSNSISPIIELKLENIHNPASAIKANIKEEAIVGWPSKNAISLMLTAFGFNYSYYNWHDIGIKNWEYIEDYYRDERISLIAKIRDFLK